MTFHTCERCKKKFIPSRWNQVYCGSKTKREGCSWWNANEKRNKRRWQNQKYREYQRKYNKKWKKQQRKNGGAYALRQLEAKREYYKTEKGKRQSQKWRKKNTEKILFWNKRRIFNKKNAQGSFSWKEWLELKEKYNYKCAICKIYERDLATRYKDDRFKNLTIDHIKPIARGGNNYVANIQPLCISCNAKKHAK